MAKQRISVRQQRSELGYAQTTSVTSFTTLTALTGLEVSVNVPAGATIIVEGYMPQMYSTVGTDRIAFSIYEDGIFVTASYSGGNLGSSNGWGGANVRARLQPSAGTHVYKLYATRDVGTGTGNAYSDANSKGFIQVRIV